MSTQEDREWDERQEYGYSHPLDPFARMSEIIADQFGPVDDDPHVDEHVDKGYTLADLQREKSLDRAREFLDELG